MRKRTPLHTTNPWRRISRTGRAAIAAWLGSLMLALALMGTAEAADKAEAPAGTQVPVLLALGTSLTAGYGLPAEDGFVAALDRRLAERGVAVRILDAGVSGDTTAGGRARLDWLLTGEITHAIVELGSNDALRGLPVAEAEANLAAILETLTGRGIKVLLAGMLAPPNMGADYAEAFAAIYPRLAERHGVALYPFFLEGVAAEPALNQADGIHPNAQGVEVIVEGIAPHVERLLAGTPAP
ncbi:MAG: arylesterase [Alphaproteobacteria bacterium]|nr:arylesterase [Alphaproteobacteria bacterium]